MKKPYPGMAPLITLLTSYLDNVGRTPISEATAEDIARSRATVYPTSPPFSWITGGVVPSVTIDEGSAPARDGAAIPLRWYTPAGDRPGRPLVVFLHGGGWVQGSTRMYDPLCSHLAAELDALVVSVDYRLAPEHRAPTAAHDAVDATRWLVEVGGRDHDRSRVALCGDSAGGNLAAVVAQELRGLTVEGTTAIRHQALIYPATDMTLASPSIREHAHAPVLTEANVHAFRAHYLGSGPEALPDTDPLVSPLFGDVSGVAPALVQTGDLDPIRDDGTRYADVLREAGVPVRLTNYVGLPHGFASFPGVARAGAQHREELVSELRRHLVDGV
ncbi:alpha/beta hydrolase [Janibacter sp. DB-40]|uniref:alpha/beta hydrolase n=1 Tax=Janibacter sp. DB-40 TaxID=3028808 RepID=UPI00240599D6|nr:alpha/beta hydrolase [Janibacter sp. DB-40]